MKEEILKKLNLHEIKKSKVEKDLGMPQNSLSGMLKGSKEIPSKWLKPLTEYIEKLDNPNQPQKEAQQEPETEKSVESTQIPIEACTMHDKTHIEPLEVGFTVTEPVVYEKGNEKVILASVIEANFGNIVKVAPILLGGDSNSKFDQLLKQFNELVDLTDKPKDIKLKLEQIKETAKNSNLTPRQTDSITDRVNFYINGQYGKAKHSLNLS
jgi:hypothetical protein